MLKAIMERAGFSPFFFPGMKQMNGMFLCIV